MKYREIKLENNKSVLVDESAEIKEGGWFYNPETKECVLASKRMLSWNNDTSHEHKGWIEIIATINHSIDLDVPMVVVEDEVEKLAFVEYPIRIDDDYEPWYDGNKEDRDIWIKGYKSAQQKYQFTKAEMKLCFLETDMNRSFEEFIQSLKKEYIELETEQYTQNLHKDIWYEKIKTNRVDGQLMAFVKK